MPDFRAGSQVRLPGFATKRVQGDRHRFKMGFTPRRKHGYRRDHLDEAATSERFPQSGAQITELGKSLLHGGVSRLRASLAQGPYIQ